MCYTGLIKRLIPFAATFAIGLFVASFFVAITFPALRLRGGDGFNRLQRLQQLRIENDELREKNRLLRMQNEELRRNADTWDAGENDLVIPSEDFDAHHPPPPPPKRPKDPRFE